MLLGSVSQSRELWDAGDGGNCRVDRQLIKAKEIFTPPSLWDGYE
jgi:hypothetical protein